jgi:PAS domain S-box-containing protein
MAKGAGAFLDAQGIVLGAARAGIAADPQNRIRHINSSAVELFGYEEREAQGRNLQELLDARDVFGNRLCAHHCAFHEMASVGEAPESFELDVRTADGDRMRVAVSVIVVHAVEPEDHTLVYLMTPMRRRRRADEVIDRILSGDAELRLGTGARLRGNGDRTALTNRQREVLSLLAAGLNVREISEDLGISVHTVRSHIRNIFEILEVSSQLEAVAKALRERLI